MSTAWPEDPQGDMTPILELSVEEAKMRHPSNVDKKILTGADRCDRCSAAAAYRASLPDKILELDLCLHHWRQRFPAMNAAGWVIVGANPDVVDGSRER